MEIVLFDMNEEFKNLPEVSSPTILYRNKLDENGLFSEKIFGPVEDYKCACGRLQGRENANKICDNCHVCVTSSAVRGTAFAKITVPDYVCVVHPLTLMILQQYIKNKKDMPKDLAAIVEGRIRYTVNNGEYVIAEHDDVNPILTGPVFFRDQLYPYLKSKLSDIEEFDSVYGSNLFIKYIPVIPPDTRPIIMASSDKKQLFTDPINEKYMNIIRTIDYMKKSAYVFDRDLCTLQNQVTELIMENFLRKFEKKKGFLRSHILGKRIDYSGRAVITVDGKNLPLGWCKIPLTIAKEIYKPSIIKDLSERLNVSPIKILDDYDREEMIPHILKILKEKFRGTYVILNRQPSLHRPSIQSSRIYDIIEDDVIVIHPLITEPFNADFDGDAMAIYVPQSIAKPDAINKMWVDQNRLPSNGQIMFKFKQDMVLGLYQLTRTDGLNEEDFVTYLNQKTTKDRILVFQLVIPKVYHNNVELFKLFNTDLDKSKITNLIDKLDYILTKNEWLQCIDKLCKLGFKFSHATLSINDFVIDKTVEFNPDTIEDNHATRMIRSGARGSWDQYRQAAVEKGFVSDVLGKVIPSPIEHSLLDGLNEQEYFMSCYGGRKGLIDIADNTAKSGYLTRQLIYLLSNVILDVHDVNNSFVEEHTFTFHVRDEHIAKMLINRYTTDGLITKENYMNIIDKTIQLYSPITCSNKKICKKCYGELYNIHKSRMIGIIAAQSLGERTTQLTLRTKHTSGSTDNILNDVDDFLAISDGVLISKEQGSVVVDNQRNTISFIFDDVDYDIDGFEEFDIILPDEYRRYDIDNDDKIEYAFAPNMDIANVSVSSKDVVSAVIQISSFLSAQHTNESIQDFLYELIDLYGNYSNIDLVHFELIASVLCRNKDDITVPYRYKIDQPYEFVNMNKVISLMPEQALAFERFKYFITKYIVRGVNECEEFDFSLLKTLLFFDFDDI